MGVLWDWTSWPWSNVRLRGNNLMFLFTYLIDLIFRKLFICEIERLGLGPMSIWGETLQNFTSHPMNICLVTEKRSVCTPSVLYKPKKKLRIWGEKRNPRYNPKSLPTRPNWRSIQISSQLKDLETKISRIAHNTCLTLSYGSLEPSLWRVIMPLAFLFLKRDQPLQC